MIDTLLRIYALIRKELLAILSDRKSRITVFVPPILQCLIFGYAASYDLNHVPYVILDLDHSAASQQFIATLDGSGYFDRVATLRQATEIAPQITNKRAVLAVVVERDFERQLMADRVAKIQVISDGRNTNTAGTAQGYVGTIAADFAQKWRQDNGRAAPYAVQVSSRAWYNPNLETRWDMIPSLIGTITMMMTMVLTAMSVAREREAGTFEQLLVTPYRPTEIMIGKALPCMLVGLVQATSILLVAQLWFRIPFAGSYFILYLNLIEFLAASVGIGLFISSISRNMQQAMIGTVVIMVPFMLLSGLTTPIMNMPDILQLFTYANPLRYAISMTRQIYLEGAGIIQLLPEMLALLVIAAATLPVAAWMFRNRLA
ncbi:MAG TPA: ABC transporter permease [Candidatus Sulfotelmatobacter sp.]|jgi:ABC-2 type transport system permease protein|nr:ABC transporter permease [Candidatus Sulfotelmatobacter sp.]